MTLRHGTLDVETWSAAGYVWDEERQRYVGPPGASQGKKGLPVIGAAAYAEHPSTDILLVRWRLPGGPMCAWQPGEPNPQALFDYLAAGGVLEHHNRMFEYLIWYFKLTPVYGWPLIPFYQTRCSMATARVNGYPGALDNLGDVLHLEVRKNADGKRLLDKWSMPRNPTKKDPRHRVMPPFLPGYDPADAEDWAKLGGYCEQDVDTEIGASQRMRPMDPDELLAWWVDQEINFRGLGVDREGVRAGIVILNQALAQYGAEFKALTGLDPTQLEKFKGWLAAFGVHMPTMDDDAITAALKKAMPPAPWRALTIRQLVGSASVKKLFAIENSVNSDNRIRNLLVHHGTGPGRPSGDGAQPLNMPKAGPKLVTCEPCGRPYRPALDGCPWCGATERTKDKKGNPMSPRWTPEMADHVLEVMAYGELATVEYFFGSAMLAISGCLRSLFVAGPGKELIASDYSSLQAVVLAQLAGEQWRIDAFKNKEPIYLLGASKITGRPLQFYLDYHAANGEHHEDRQYVGKVSELACFTRETQVLTHRGYVDIVAVTDADLLWDGVEWVKSRGVVAKGTAATIRLDGVEMTPTHKIICNGYWREARQLVSKPSRLSQALANGSANLPSWAKASPALSASNVPAERPNTPSTWGTSLKARAPDAGYVPDASPAAHARTFGPTPISFRTTRIGDACLTASPRASSAAITPRTRVSPTMGVGAFTSRPSFMTGGSSWPTSRPLKAGTFPFWNWIAKTSTKAMSRAILGSSRNAKIKAIAAPSKSCSGASSSLKPVFDIAYAGPRNRFTIRTNSGHLIVHNCGFQGWIGAWRTMEEQQGIVSPFTDDEVESKILAWRAENPAIIEFWGGQHRGRPWDRDRRQEYFGVEGAFIQAILYPGQVFEVRGIKFFMETTPAGTPALIIQLLPTRPGVPGRRLTYHQPSLSPSHRDPTEYAITYWKWNSNPKYGAMGWGPMSTWGGRITENIVMAHEVDIMRHATLNLRAAGYPMVLPVYDEAVVEVPIGTGSVEEVERIMEVMPLFAQGWPVRADSGWRGRRYRKAQ